MADAGTVYDELAAQWATAFGVNVVKGKPTWARPDVVLPVAALEIMAWSPDAPACWTTRNATNSGLSGLVLRAE